MSLRKKKWVIKNTDKNKTIFQKLLSNRDLKEDFEIKDFHDPFLFSDMKKSVERIDKAIANSERIIIFGDYDVDGISGTALLMHALTKVKANVSCRLPNRLEDGYGLSEKFIDEFIEKNIGLIITVDCGISCKNVISKAKNAGIDTIITDHHTIPDEFPSDAFAILHPKLENSNYPFEDLTGAGVALKLAHALAITNLPKDQYESFLESLLDLASLGTVADLGSLKDENHLIVKRGLKRLENTKWAGLKKLKELANLKEGEAMDTNNIGFHIAPRINAAGRIGDPYIALKLLLQQEYGKQTQSLGQSLENLNKERQKMTETSLDEAKALFVNPEDEYILIAHSPDWHVGILGLIAGKLSEKYGRPAIAMQDFGDMLVASARSPQHFNVVEAIKDSSEHLMSFGGHAQAAGFNLKKESLKAFEEKIKKFAKSKLKNKDLTSILEIDCEIKNSEINFDILNEIQKLAPFGVANQRPSFLLRNVEPLFVQQVGKGGDHLKFNLNINGSNFNVIAFRMGSHIDDIRRHRKLDIVFNLENNTWNNRSSLQLQALDFKLN